MDDKYDIGLLEQEIEGLEFNNQEETIMEIMQIREKFEIDRKIIKYYLEYFADHNIDKIGKKEYLIYYSFS